MRYGPDLNVLDLLANTLAAQDPPVEVTFRKEPPEHVVQLLRTLKVVWAVDPRRAGVDRMTTESEQ